MSYKILFSAVAFAFIIGCSQPPNYGKECSAIKNIRIINRTGNVHIVDTSIISDISSIQEFCRIMSKKININNPNVKVNFGFYQMDIIFISRRESSVDVIYTTYDGIILSETGNVHSKQNEILEYILRNVKYK